MTRRARQHSASTGKKNGQNAEKRGKTPPATPHDGASSSAQASNGTDPPRMGRPTKLTADLKERLIGALRSGAPNETAAGFAGIAESTFYAWLARAQEDLKNNPEIATDYTEFQEAVEKAQAEAELEKLLIINAAAKGKPTTEGAPGTAGQWQAAAWFLERRHPERYGRRIVTIPDPDPEDPRKKGKPAAKKQYFRFGGQVLEI
jgi:transposase-like protein